MNSIQIETWVISVVEQVLHGKPNEDSRVELKAIWPIHDYKGIARQLGGHANLARGELILWIIGVNERKREIIGAQHEEASNWYAKIKSQFHEGHAPTPQFLNINYDSKVIVAIVFDTERFPFLVKTSEEYLEVPWREGTSTRSAYRSDLLKILTPLQMSPELEAIAGTITLHKVNDTTARFVHYLEYYIIPNDASVLVVPFRRCSAKIEIANSDFRMDVEIERIHPPYRLGGSYTFAQPSGSKNLSRTLEEGSDELIVSGPGKFILRQMQQVSDIPVEITEARTLIFHFSLLPISVQVPTRCSISLNKVGTGDPNVIAHWAFKT